MKSYLPCLLLFVSLFCVSCWNSEKKDAQAYLGEAARLYQERCEDTAAIDAVLTEGVNAYPGNIPLLQSRGNLYCSRGMLAGCRADTLRLLELKPGLVEARMMLCMLDEFEKVCGQSCEPCYLEVANLLAERPADSPDKEIADKANRVFALLMAGHPDAEEEKNAFLSSVASDPRAWAYHGMLDNFDREKALLQIFGQ